MRRSNFVVAALLATMVGCGDAAAPGWISVEVALADVGGAPPPVRPWPTSTVDLIADTIVLQADGIGRRHVTLRRLEDSVVVAAEISIRWESDGSAIRLYHWCPPNGIAPCPTEPELAGPIRADVWSVTGGSYFERPARYRVLERVRALP